MTASTALCVVCERPVPDVAYACPSCALRLAQTLREAAGHAEDAGTVIARQARYGAAGGGIRKPEPEAVTVTEANRRNPVTAFGWQASVERPRQGALYPEPMPYDDGAADRLADISGTVTTWARHVCETRGVELPARRPLLGPLCADAECGHASCARVRHRRPPSSLGEAAAWLATQAGWLRTRPEAREAFDELGDACRMLRRLIDSPASDRLVGMCDCGRTLYAANGRTVVQCPEKTCELRWDVERSQQILRDHLDETLMTAAEAARLAVHLDGGERGVEQVRKLIGKWAQRREVLARGRDRDGDPTYRFGDVAERLARTPTRTPRDREGAAA